MYEIRYRLNPFGADSNYTICTNCGDLTPSNDHICEGCGELISLETNLLGIIIHS